MILTSTNVTCIRDSRHGMAGLLISITLDCSFGRPRGTRCERHRVETPTELARMIRFSLDELSRENGHHTFEDLSRELAQARLVSNVLPATGPVAGGGDQGRDFETFRTYLAGSLHFSRGFIGLASPDTVVFACTIQREDVKGKIK